MDKKMFNRLVKERRMGVKKSIVFNEIEKEVTHAIELLRRDKFHNLDIILALITINGLARLLRDYDERI